MGKCTTEKFIEKAKKKYGDKYDYSKVEYKGYNVKICIICHKKDKNGIEHGEFWQTPESHLQRGKCPKCGLEQMKKSLTKTTEQFIEEAKKAHGDKYDYSKVKYVDAHTKVCIICPKHGEFWQIPNGHLEGKGCYHCGVESSASSLFSNTNEFIKKARQIHGDKYDYSKVEYKHNQTKVCIICPTHGEFWMTPNNHIGASNKCGCPKCKMSKLENFVIKLLEENNIDYIYECSKKDLNWLGRQRLDFYIPTKKIVLECQGLQHFIPSDFGGQSEPEENLKKNIKSDIKKFNKCTENGLNVLYIVDDKKSIIDIPIYKYNNVYSKEEFIKFITDEINN